MRTTRKAAVLATAVLALGMASVVPIAGDAAAGAAVPKVAVRTVQKMTHGYITTTKNPDGSVVKVYDARGPVTMTTPVVAQHTMQTKATAATDTTTTTEYSAEGEITVPVTTKDSLPPTDVPSDYDMLLAMGVSETDAAVFQVNAVGPIATSGGGDTIQPGPGPNVAPNATPTVTANVTASSAQLWNRSCVDFSVDGGRGHFHGCDDQYRVWVNPYNRTDWFMEDKHLATGTMHDTALFFKDKVTGVLFGVHYGAYNLMYNWQPSVTSPVGSCKSTTSSVSVKFYTVSNTATSCPEEWGVYTINNQTFTTKWNGKGNGPSDGARATHGVSSTHSPSSASATRGLPFKLWWT